jgi:protein involved in polysaccharide export with SLBB domain
MISLLLRHRETCVLFGLFFLFAALAAPSARAQGALGQVDFARIQVDNLTDAQIEYILNAAEEQDMTEEDIEALALLNGMSRTEISKLRARMQAVHSRQQAASAFVQRQEPEFPPPSSVSLPVQPEATDATQRDSVESNAAAAQRIFGDDLFNTAELTFAPSINIPTPQDYQLGPGDELVVNVWGAAQMTYLAPVSPEGTIVLENLGPIFVSGLSIEEAERRILSRLSQVYAGLNVEEPSQGNTFGDVSLGNLRSIRVHIVGEVERPGSYTLSSLSTVFNALYVCGGPSDNGTFRRIQVIRNNSIITELDIYNFLVYGEQTGNIRLNDQDIIKVDPYLARVSIDGEVKRPMQFEIREGETLADLLRFAGSFSAEAYQERLRIHRNTASEKRLVDAEATQFASFQLQNGDEVFVDRILNRFENRVEIRGAVFRTGEYELGDAQTVYGLIQNAEGLAGDALLSRGQIYRTRPDQSVELITFDVARLLQDPATFDIALQRDDVVVIPSITGLREQYYVEITGSIQEPGSYPYMENMTLEDLIVMARGFKDEASLLRVEVSRRRTAPSLGDPQQIIAETYQLQVDSGFDLNAGAPPFVLQPFDRVFVRRSPYYAEQQDVRVSGEILYPGSYTLETKNDRISDIIRRSGGLTAEAFPRGAVLMRTGADSGAVGINLEQILARPGSEYDLLVQAGDSIYVPRLLQTVQVSGAVYRPSLARFVQGLSLRDYINGAGGPTDQADLDRAYVIYANGSVDRVRNGFLGDHYPRIEPGAEIVIPSKPENQGMTTQERTMMYYTMASIAAVLTTAIIQIVQLVK